MTDYFFKISGGIPEICQFLAIRGLPFVFYIVSSLRVTIRTKIICIAVYTIPQFAAIASGIGVSFFELLVVPFISFAYFCLIACLVYWLRDQLEKERLGKGALFVLCSFAFVLLPAIFVPGPNSLTAELVGWEMMFSAYSYCVDTVDSHKKFPLSECLFFVIVNPTLVFGKRGHRVGEPSIDLSALLRCTTGLVVYFSQILLYSALVAFPFFGSIEFDEISDLVSYGEFFVYYLVHLVVVYFAHSGRASFEIGLMKLIGYHVPERYRYPFLAGSPEDFWKRWNIYLGAWARRYVFLPLAFYWKRRWRESLRGLAVGAAAIATFIVIGLVHDYSLYVRRLSSWPPGGTVAFLMHGIVLVIWILVNRRFIVRDIKRRRSATYFKGRVFRIFSWLLFLHFIVFMGWITIPSLSGEGLPKSIVELLGFLVI